MRESQRLRDEENAYKAKRAKLYLADGMTKADIARNLRVSSSKVAYLLEHY